MELDFFPRTLWHQDDSDIVEVAHTELDALFRADNRPLIVLGEAGMGKTELLRWFAETHRYSTVTAQQLLLPPRPGRSLDTAQGLVIDALDELYASSPTDAILKVIEALGSLGYPRFILSCRSSDWLGAASADLIQTIYGEFPYQLHLRALTPEQIEWALENRLGALAASDLIAHLKARRFSSWLGNPHTLKLIMGIADSGSPLPEGRTELFQLAAEQLLSERNEFKSISAPTREDAIAAAGGAFAALIICGFGAISRAAKGDDALSMAEAVSLPGGIALAQVLGTRLFDAAGIDRFNYTHRSLGEYLGAQWLTQQANSPRKRRRLLALFHHSGLVPASLRGIHAWLARNADLAPQVIAADPMGIIEYGDPEQLTSLQARALLHALDMLATRNPDFLPNPHKLYFRIASTQEMDSDVLALLEQPEKSVQLRLLLLDSIRGTTALRRFLPIFEVLVRNSVERYVIRQSALEGLYDSLSVEQCLDLIRVLVSHSTDDSARLALNLTGLRGYAAFDDACIVKLVMTCAQQEFRFGEKVGKYDHLASHFPSERIGSFLNDLTETSTALMLANEVGDLCDLAEMMKHLIARYLEEETVVSSDVLRWLRFISLHRGRYYLENPIDEHFEQAPLTRRAIQHLALLSEDGIAAVTERHQELVRLSDGLQCSEHDAIALLNALDPNDLEDQRWRDVMGMVDYFDDSGADLLAAARLFAVNHPGRLRWIEQLTRGTSEVDLNKFATQYESLRPLSDEQKLIALSSLKLREIQYVCAENPDSLLEAAMVYLGALAGCQSCDTAHGRLVEELGQSMADNAIRGFEAYLQAIPLTLSAADVACIYADQCWILDTLEIGLTQGIAPLILIAAVSERHRTGMGFGDLTEKALLIAFFSIQHVFSNRPHILCSVLDGEIEDRALWKEAIGLFYEPQLCRGFNSDLLDELPYLQTDRKLLCSLANDWLRRLMSMAATHELTLIKILFEADQHETLRTLAHARTPPSAAHRRNWDAAGLLVDFHATAVRLGAGSIDEALLYCLYALEPAYFRSDFGRHSQISVPLAQWIIANFRSSCPNLEPDLGDVADLVSGISEVQLGYLIGMLSDLNTPDAAGALTRLCDAPRDTYTTLLLNAKATQQRRLHEAAFKPSTLNDLIAITKDELPHSSSDLQAWMLEELVVVQAKITSDDVDSWRGFYRDNGTTPKDEERCRDHLLALLRQGSEGVVFEPETHVAADREVDITCATLDARLPIEIKGQWHRTLWTAADDQLDRFYTPDHRAGGFGIYLVLWFGKQTDRHFVMKSPGAGITAPSSAQEMAEMIQERSLSFAQGRVKVVVLDLSREVSTYRS
jgi:hypothetical protein